MTEQKDKANIPESASKLPASPADEQELVDRCADDRDEMSPRETADCAGAALAELYDTEENGGS